MMDIQTCVALCKIKEFEDGLPKYATSRCHSMRTTSGLQIMNEIGRRLTDDIEHEACAMMSRATREQAIEWLDFIGFVEDNIALSNVCNASYCAAVKIAALRLIAMPTQTQIELKGISV